MLGSKNFMLLGDVLLHFGHLTLCMCVLVRWHEIFFTRCID